MASQLLIQPLQGLFSDKNRSVIIRPFVEFYMFIQHHCTTPIYIVKYELLGLPRYLALSKRRTAYVKIDICIKDIANAMNQKA